MNKSGIEVHVFRHLWWFQTWLEAAGRLPLGDFNGPQESTSIKMMEWHYSLSASSEGEIDKLHSKKKKSRAASCLWDVFDAKGGFPGSPPSVQHGPALASCPGGFVWVPQGPSPGAWAAFLTGTGRKREKQLVIQARGHFKNLGMCLKMSVTAFSPHSSCCLARWQVD